MVKTEPIRNVMHASMETTDEIYNRFDEKEVRIRIERLGKEDDVKVNPNDDAFSLIHEFLEWRKEKIKEE